MSGPIEEFSGRLFRDIQGPDRSHAAVRRVTGPVHVVYGGADLFTSETVAKLGGLALRSLETYAPDIHSFATAMWLRGAESVPQYQDVLEKLVLQLESDPTSVKGENEGAWLAWTVRDRVKRKLETEPIEDFRIDFEDGFGMRPDEEEDAHAERAARETSKAIAEDTLPRHFGIRIKSFQRETFGRAVRTLDIFTEVLLASRRVLPTNFVVTLPKIVRSEEVSVLAELLERIELKHSCHQGSIGIEVMVETPECLFDLGGIVGAGRGRVTSAHFGAYDYTASLGITAAHQHIGHDACVFARQMMLAALSPLGVRLSDSVTTEMPVAVHRDPIPTEKQAAENRRVVHNAWRRHFNNVTDSLINGFYQSWDLHPAQLVARYAALTAFFLDGAEAQGGRLKGFLERATKATMHGNVFDDAASAQGYLNFFMRAVSVGAMTYDEVLELTGLTSEEVDSGSFREILKGRTGNGG